MTDKQYIFHLKDILPAQSIGGKARNLRFLIDENFKTPETYVCTCDAYLNYLKDPSKTSGVIKEQLSIIPDLNHTCAVRSSANLEDKKDYSFAGQFKSFLNVQGKDNILHAIESIWSSACSPGVKTYLKKINKDIGKLKMAVIIQEMVTPVFSGISFSKNPMTGLDEIIVEAVMGSGETLQQDGITPLRWVNKWGEWTTRPDNESIDQSIIQDVVTATKKISRAYSGDIDLEWVYNGHSITWVQLRDITSLKNLSLYSNNIAKEVFPGIIKPLIWSINVPLVCGAWVKLFTELVGENHIDPNSLAKAFYYRAYFNMGTIGKILKTIGLPDNILEIMMGTGSNGSEKPSFKPTKRTLTHLPRILLFTLDKFTFARKIKAFLPSIMQHYSSLPFDRIDQLDEKQILSEIKILYDLNEKTAYYTIVTLLLMGMYNGILKHQLKKNGVDFDNIGLTSNMDEFKQFDPTIALMSLNQQFSEMDEGLKDRISRSSYNEFLALKGIDLFRDSIERFIRQFGHLSDSGNDFSKVPWRENLDIILNMIINYKQPDNKSSQKISFENSNLSFLRRSLLTPLYKRSRDYRLYREKVSFLYTYGYGLFRTYFLALADHFLEKRLIAHRDDIFYLYFNEICDMVGKEDIDYDYRDKIKKRKFEINEYQEIFELPTIVYGDNPPPIRSRTHNTLKGIPTSQGFYKGQTMIIHGLEDFYKLREGDVLVIPYSDVGWTPLFSKAGAIIAESGGFLSHSSIIAREYGIPAIVSVSGACNLKDNTTVTVDAYQGEVIIHDLVIRKSSS